jgi:hypothetical protein
MRRIGTIVVEKSTKLTPIAMTILTGKNDDPLEKWLSDKLKTVLSMPGILNSEKKKNSKQLWGAERRYRVLTK